MEWKRYHIELALSRDADLTEANFAGAKLGWTSMVGVDLTEANFAGAYLTGADLTGADLTGVDLTGAKLGWVDLTGANMSNADLGGALYNKFTRWPIGFDPGAAGALRE